jgi:hypothetical protein
MKLPRRQLLHLAAGAAALPVVSRIARAQAYPTRPVRLIISVFGVRSTFGVRPTPSRLVVRALSARPRIVRFARALRFRGTSKLTARRPDVGACVGRQRGGRERPASTMQMGGDRVRRALSGCRGLAGTRTERQPLNDNLAEVRVLPTR